MAEQLENNKKTFRVDGDIVDIPSENVSSFLEDFPNAEEMSSYIVDGDTVDIPVENSADFIKDFPNATLTFGDVKKKESTEPTQDAPLQGLGGVSEEPTPSPSVGQGVLRDVDQTQPTGEEFITQVSEGVLDQEPVEEGATLTPTSEITEPIIDEDLVPDSEELAERTKLYERRIQSERNENLKKYSLNVPNEELTEVFREPISEEENLDSYLSTQIGKVSSSARNIANNPKAFGLPSDINLITPQEREDVVDQYVARATKLGFGRRISEDSPNLNESELRNVFNNEFDKALAKKKTDKDVLLRKQRNEDLDKRNIPEESRRTIDLIDLKKQDVASMTNTKEVELYSSNRKLQDIADKLSSTKDPIKLDELTSEYNKELSKSNSLREEIGDDRKVMVDYITGQHVDNISDDDDANITEAVNAQIVEFSQPTYKDQLDDLYIKVGLRDNSHKEYGSNFKNDVYVATQGMARPLSSDAALNHLRSMGYETEGKVGGVVFKDVPLNVQASSYVINVLPDKGKKEAERWLQENKKNIIEREALKDMVLLNVDPGKYDKSKLARGLEVLAEESLPSYVSVDKALGFTSDRKLIDAALPLLQEEGIELTKEQEENLERTFGEEATEATFGMAPVIVKLAAINSIAGPLRAVSGFGNLVDKLSKSKSLVDKGIALFLDASFEEVQMQTAGFDPGTGFGFNVAGKIFKGIGLDKFPFKGKGEMARFNKSADALWNHAIKGASSAEFASNVEAVIKDFEGGETWQNFADENYSNLSDVTKRMLVNGVAFGVLGLRDVGFFIKKGKSGFNISNMEKARDESQRKGYKEEADMLTKYINEYYAGKPGKPQTVSYNDMKLLVENMPENESQEFTVSSLEEVPVEFRDRTKKNESVETEVDRTFLGIPLGTRKSNSGESYSYKLTGQEMREVLEKRQGEKTEAEFEQEFDMSQKAEEPSVGKEDMKTEPTEAVKRKGRVTKFSAKKGDIVGEIVFEDGTKRELTQKEYDALGKQEGLFDIDVPVEKKITKEEYEMQMAKKFAETQPTPKEPAAKEQLALGEGKVEPKEAAPIDIASEELLRDVDESPEKYGYHGGNLQTKSDYLSKAYRGEQPWTGYYFFGDKGRALARGNRSRASGDPTINDARAVDFSKYNLLKPTTNGYWALKAGLKRIESNLEKGNSIDSQIENISSWVPEVGRWLNENKSDIQSIFNEWKGIKELKLKGKPTGADGKLKQVERFETFLLKKMGYEGIDVRGLKESQGEASPDTMNDGSVIFDLKEGTVVDVTPKKEKDAVQKQEAADAPKIEPLTKEDAKSEEKVKEFVEKNLSDEKKNEEADKEIESKSEEELKEDVPDVLESISEAERGKLDREAKNKRKSTVDYVIDYLKGKLKNVRQSIKNILEKIKSNYRKAIITTAVIASVVKGSDVKIGGTSLRDVFKDVTELVVTEGKSQGENLALDFAVENPEGFKAVSEVIGKNKYMSAIGAKAGVFKPKILKVEKPKVEKIEPIDTANIEGLRAKIKSIDQVFGDKVEINGYYPGVKAISYRNTFLAEEGQEYVIIPRRDERETAGNKDIEGVQYVAHFTLDDQMVGNERGLNSGIHKVSMETDGYVPYTTKKQGNREIITYKKYSEIADTAKGIGEILSTDPNIGPPLRQFKFGDIDWDAKPKWTSDKERKKEGYSGSRVMKTSVEILLKPGKKNPYRTGDMPNKDEYGNYLNPRGTYILYYGGRENAPTGDAHKGSIGKYNGGSFVYIFDYKGKTVVRDVGSSVGQLKEEGDAIIKQFGVNPKDLILGYHDAGSVSAKVEAKDGKITKYELDAVNNTNSAATGGYAIPIENKIPRDKPSDAPIGLMALPLLFGGARRKRKPLEDTDADKVVTEWMGDVQKIYDAQKTKNKQEAVNEAATNLALSGKLNELAPDQRLKVLEDIAKQTATMDKKRPVSITSELEGLTIKEQFKQGFEEYIAALKDKEAAKKLKAEVKFQEKIDKLKEKAKEAVQKAKDDVAARKIFNEIMKAEMKELGLGTLKKSEVTRLLSMAKNADKKKIEELIENGINLMVKAAKKNLKTGAEAVRKKLSDRIKKGDFGTSDQKAIAIANIPVENIPVERLPEYYELLNNLVSRRGKVSARDLNKVSDFIDSISEEIENKIGGVETLAELYDVFDSERKLESESEEYTEAKKIKKSERNARQQALINRIEGKAKEEFVSFLEELGMPSEITEFAENELDAIIKEHKRQNTEEGKPLTASQKIDKIKEKRQQAIENFNNLYPIEKGSRGVDVSLYKNNEVLAEAAAFFNKLGNNQLKDLLPSELNALPLIYENMNFGLMTSSVFRIMSRIKGSMTIDQMSESSNQFSRMLATSPKDLPGNVKTMAEDFTLPLYNLVKPETPTSVSIKDAKELGKRMLAEQTPYIKYLLKGIKGDPVYEMLNGLTGALTSASSMVTNAKRKTYDLFMGMKGLPLENNLMISAFHRIREHQALKGELDITIRNPIEYVDAKIETARINNQGLYDLMVGIKDKYFDKNGDPKMDNLTGQSLIEKEINKRGGKELVDFMDKMNEVTREMGRTIAVVRGIPYKEIDLYGASRAEHGTDNLSEKMSKITAGKTLASIKSGAVLSRTGNRKKTFDAVGDFLSSFDNTVHEYYLTEPLSTISNFVSIASKTGNVNLARYANAIKDYASGSIESQIKTNYSDGGAIMSIVNDIISTRKSGAVFGLAVKPFAETFSQINKIIFIPEARKSAMTGIKILREAGDGLVNFEKAFEFMKAIQSTHQNRAGVLNAEVYYQPGYYERKMKSETGRKYDIYNKIRPILKPTRVAKRGMQRAAEISQMAPDAFGVIQVNIGAFAEKFKELTGNYPDINKIINDKQYRAENAQVIKKSRAYADKLTSSTAAPSSMAEVSKAGYLMPPFRMGYIKKEPGKSQNLFILDTYSGSEKRTLLTNLKELRDSLMKPFITREMADSWTGSEKKTFDVLQEITGRNVAGISYQIYRLLGFAAFNTLIQILEKELFGTDEEELDLTEEFNKGAKKGILDQALLPLLGNASWVTRLMLLGGIYAAAKYTEGELDEGEESYSEDFKESMYVPDLNRYGNIPMTVSKLGFEGQVAADAMDLAMMTENLDDFDAKDIGKLSYLLSRNAAPMPQEASRTMRLFRTMEKVEKANKLISGINSSYLVGEGTRVIYNTFIDLDNDKSVLPSEIRDTESVNVDGVSLKYEIEKDKLMGLYFERGKLINSLLTNDLTAKLRTTSDPQKRKDILKSIYKEVNSNKDYQLLKDAYFLKNGKRVD